MQDKTTVNISISSLQFGRFNKAIDINLNGQSVNEYIEEVKKCARILLDLGEVWIGDKFRPTNDLSPIDECIFEIQKAMRNNK
ncbi:MAG: hypothetical protein J6Q22_09990 [Prevotella sp.]|nr:hypothetical protein [Prevotella sp.]